MQYSDNNRLFYTPGTFYRPNNLKRMTLLMGNTEKREIYKQIDLDNLNTNNLDVSHLYYTKYLAYNYFIPPNEKKFFAHTMLNMIPETADTTLNKGLFNVFPVFLDSKEISKPTSTIGVVNTAPLYLELEFTPVLTEITWFLACTFVYKSRIHFPGSKSSQEITIDYL